MVLIKTFSTNLNKYSYINRRERFHMKMFFTFRFEI